jgi:hypothetical protein
VLLKATSSYALGNRNTRHCFSFRFQGGWITRTALSGFVVGNDARSASADTASIAARLGLSGTVPDSPGRDSPRGGIDWAANHGFSS